VVDEIPRVLAGRYEVGELIGRGGMAEVHIGYDNRLSRTVAIKVLRSDLARDATFQARFRREAQSSAALNHPSIVAVYDTGEEQVATPSGQHITVPFIVMEYVEGHTVRSLLSGGDPVPIEEAAEIVVGVLSALEYSHREGIVHRDIKPGNIMLTPTGQVKVMDFGIARAMTDSAATMTQTHAVVGTAQYLSPEQARGEVVDARSDLYSTGCLLYELLTGQPPFTGDSALAVAYQHVGETPKTPSSVTPDIPEVLDRVVLKALAKDRNDRYSDAAHMRADLLAAVRGGRVEAPATAVWGAAGGAAAATAVTTPLAAAEATRMMSTTGAPARTGAPPPPAPGDEDEEPKKSRWWVWLIALLGVAAAVGIVALVLNQGDQEPPPAEMVKVPDMSDLDQVGARQKLEEIGLVPSIVDAVPSDTVEEGLFVRSNPPVGEEVEVGTKVEVAFSSGPEAVEVPNVVGMSQEQAANALESAGLASGSVKEVNDPNAAPGDVVATEPAAGASAAPGSRVNLTVASNFVDLPDLRGKPEEEASAALSALDLNVRITQQQSGEADPGEVIQQSHPAGAVERGTTVTLTVATAPPEPSPEPSTNETSEPPSDQPSDTTPPDGDNGNGNGGGGND
jgi:eukaryotic-like serine/threonine-protein kinase